MRYVTTVEDFLDLIDDAVDGLLLFPPSLERVNKAAALLASVVNIESDEILGMLISLGHPPVVSNGDAFGIVQLALHRSIAMRWFDADECVADVLSA